MDEQIDDTERRIRIKELQLAYLRGDITQAEHDRRRARYVIVEPPSGAPIWIEGEPSWHGSLVIVVWCVAVPLALLAGALWLLFGRS